MTTQIVPSSGQGALLTQQGPGTTPGYSALDIRRLFSGALQEGVYGTSTTVTAGGVSGVAAADFMVTQRGAGANLSVDINMPGGGMAFVQGDTIAGQGLYGVPVAAANINEAIVAADLTNPRVDQVILEVQDNVLDASGGNLARTRVLTGSPSASATLPSRAGAAPLPGSALLLADVLVPPNATTIPNLNIRDRRKWARGAGATQAVGSAGLTNTTTYTQITNSPSWRFECSGNPIRFTWPSFAVQLTTAPNYNCIFAISVDGTMTAVGEASINATGGQNSVEIVKPEIMITPAAGSHVFQFMQKLDASGAGVTLVNAAGSYGAVETVKQSGVNNTVTTG